MTELVRAGKQVTYESGGRRITVTVPRDAMYAERVDQVVAILYNWEKVRSDQRECLGNVVAFDDEGREAWRIEPFQFPRGSYYTGLRVSRGKLWVYASPGFDVEVDPKTGKILSSQFVK